MELIKVSDEITKKIKALEKGRDLLDQRATDYANSVGKYELAIASTLIQLKNGKAFILGEDTIESPPATLTEKIARGICYQEKIDMELADHILKNTRIKLNAIQAELMGLQSQFRHLENA
jgi:hypothetical protein